MSNLKNAGNDARELKWRALSEHVGGEAGRELVLALKELYSIYTDELIDWFVGLYDIERGGFYYCQSAVDNDEVEYKGEYYKLLPDAESTCQALGFWINSGLADAFGGSYAKAIPEWMAEDIARYVTSLQSPNGYFYHPQWTKEMTDERISRRSRDLNWCVGMLKCFGKTPKYPTIFDKKSDDGNTQTMIPPNLATEEAFEEYLASKNIHEKSYHVGSELVTQNNQMIALGRMDRCIEFLTSTQHAESGHWHHENSYYAINGIMKISGVYNGAKKPFPNAKAAAMAAMNAITSDEPIGAVVDLWNTWIAVRNLLSNLRSFGGEEGNRQADEIVCELRKRAPHAILKTKEKILPFRKEKSSFSYCREYPAVISQGMPVCIPHLPEGDVNATVISSASMIAVVYDALELSKYKIPMFEEPERKRYISLLEEKRENYLKEKMENGQ